MVARVRSYSIDGATFDRFLTAKLNAEPPSERLVPPGFSACVAHLRAESPVVAESAPSPSRLQSECQARYRTVLQTALEGLIRDEWLIGAAAELGVPVSEHVPLETKARLASEAIRRTLEQRIPRVTRAQVAGYYQQHRFQYLNDGERDLKIARTLTQAAAAKIRAELASGKSWASVVGQLHVHQPTFNNEGLVLELHPHFYGEPKLNQAIFTATPGMLYGPVGTSYGYFVFEVTKIRSERLRSMATVQPSIHRQLTQSSREQAFAEFAKRWSATWTAHTDCNPQDVVPGCRQYKGPPAPPPEGPLGPG
jgi:hypothetical protein